MEGDRSQRLLRVKSISRRPFFKTVSIPWKVTLARLKNCITAQVPQIAKHTPLLSLSDAANSLVTVAVCPQRSIWPAVPTTRLCVTKGSREPPGPPDPRKLKESLRGRVGVWLALNLSNISERVTC